MELNIFEQKVFNGLQNCGLNISPSDSNLTLGAAVSGGADSIAMLTALLSLGFKVEVITVNHYIRPDKETCADVDFVLSYCRELANKGYKVNCTVKELKRGQVTSLSEKRGCGIEEAARFLRYEAFDAFIKEKNLEYLCLAHNQNDQIETLVMRFLQGSSGNAVLGILNRREEYIRPLLEINRSQIEEYLKEKNLSWQTDSSNFDTKYLRNKIRHKVIPLLDEEFPGWQKAVLSGAEKQVEDKIFIQKLLDGINIEKTSDGNSVTVKDFFSLPMGMQVQLLLRMCNLCSEENRIPYKFLKDTVFAFNHNEDCFKIYADLEIIRKKDHIIVKKYSKSQTDLCFFDIIEKEGRYEFPFGNISFMKKENLNQVFVNDQPYDFYVNFPVCVRNAQAGDVVLDKEGHFRKVSDVYTAWKVPKTKKDYIPLIQGLDKNQKILCILGGAIGFDNWIVKE